MSYTLRTVGSGHVLIVDELGNKICEYVSDEDILTITDWEHINRVLNALEFFKRKDNELIIARMTENSNWIRYFKEHGNVAVQVIDHLIPKFESVNEELRKRLK